MIRSYRNLGVLVLIDTRHDRELIPDGVRSLLSSGSYGNTIPMVFVTSPDGSKGITGASYASLSGDIRGTRRDLQREISEAGDLLAAASGMTGDDEESAAAGPVESDPGPALLAETQEWSNADGRSIRAAVERIEGDTVRFLMPNGSTADYPIANLSEESRERISQLAQAD